MNAIVAAFYASVIIVGHVLYEKHIDKLEKTISKQQKQIYRYRSRIEELEDNYGHTE